MIKLYIGTASDIASRASSADYSNYRWTQNNALVLTDDLKSGPSSGDAFGNNLEVVDYDGQMVPPVSGQRVLIYDDADSSVILFSGVIANIERRLIGVDGAGLHYSYILQLHGFQWEGDANGIEEDPVYNVNAGAYLRQLMQKYTLLEEGFIDDVNSPTINFIRLSNFRRFSTVGTDLASLWLGSEFFIDSGETTGKVYFRQAATSNAPIVLNDAYIQEKGTENVKITEDSEKMYNIVRLPFYKLQRREPDFFIQDATADPAFLKTSVTLNGQPSGIEQSVLLLEDFSSDISANFVEDDVDNPNPPAGFSTGDGYLIAGEVNTVSGLHMLDTAGASPAIQFGDIGLSTDPATITPFTGDERQMLICQELVIDALGDAIVCGIIDPTTVSTLTIAGSTASALNVADASQFSVGDRITVLGQKTYISSIGTDTLNVNPALLSAPSAGVTVTKHRLALSRVKFGVLFKASGDLRYILNGVETAFDTPRTYSALQTYSLRLFMQCFETTTTGTITATGCGLTDATNFQTGDVVEIFTQGSRNDPEERVITVAGGNISYSATNYTPKAGYRVRLKPKMVLQIKGGAEYGDINGRGWTTLYTALNTWQTVAGASPSAMGVLMVMPKSLVGTLNLLEMKNPPGVTANIGSRYLMIGTQETETSNPDIDCIIRKVGSHYQMDFFADTKDLWSSGTRLELRYSEKFEWHLEDRDTDSMRALAADRGQTIPANASEEELARLGGRALDTVELLPNPITLQEAINQCSSVLSAVKDKSKTVEITTTVYLDGLVKSGQVIKSELSDVPDQIVQRVVITELVGASNDGAAVFAQEITAGSIDRLTDVLLKRKIKNGSRLVIDDGLQVDSFTKIQKTNVSEKATTNDIFEVSTCNSPTRQVYSGTQYTTLRCLLIA